jgi:hypothetical protein
VTILDASSGNQVNKYTSTQPMLFSVAWSPDGKYIATEEGKYVITSDGNGGSSGSPVINSIVVWQA